MRGTGPLRQGEVIGGAYCVVTPIGRGGMGTVYRAIDVATQRPVALKVMLSGAVTPVRLARFEREAELAARLDRHHGIARVYASGLHRGLPFIAMELVEGQDLETILEQGPLPVDRAVELLEAIAHAVGACHAGGVVHRDLKPGNVLLGEDGPKVVDFGLARDADGAGERLTRTGELVGTPFYMPPEQLAGAVVDARADVYALGAILYHALTGRPPFVGSTLMELAARASTGRLAPPSTLRAGVSQDIDTVCARALARRPEDRYADGTALALDLERLRRRERPTASAQMTSWAAIAVLLARARQGERRALLLVSVVSLTVLGLCATIVGQLVVRPGRAASAVLGEVLEWDGERCERAPAACKQGAHVLARWDLGLGDGPPPTLSEVDRRRAALEGVQGRLEGEEALTGRDAAARLVAVRPLLGAETGAQPERATSATECLVDALALRARGDVEGAQERVDRALALQPDSLAAVRLRARLWADRLAARPAAAGQLAAWLEARGRTPLERDLALEGAAEGLPRAYLRLVARAPELVADDGAELARSLASVLAAAGALNVDQQVRAAIAREKQAALEDAAARWEGALADALARDSAADVRALGRLGVAVRHAPAIAPGARLEEVLARALDARVALGTADVAITRAARFDAALVHRVGLEWPVQEDLALMVLGFMDAGLRVQLRDVDVDLILCFMRSARARGERVSVVAARTGPERLEALLRERPRSLALRLCLLAVATGEREEPVLSREVLERADALFVDPVVDVSAIYLIEARLQVLRVRWVQLREAQRGGAPAAERAHALVAAAEALLDGADWARPEHVWEALERGADGAAALSVERGLAWREDGVAAFRRRVERGRATGATAGGMGVVLQEELRHQVRVLLSSAHWGDTIARTGTDRVARRARATAWWTEALAVCEELDVNGLQLANTVRATYEARPPE